MRRYGRIAGAGAVSVGLLAGSAFEAAAQTRVALAGGEAWVVFPVGAPERAPLTEDDVSQLQKLESAGSPVDWKAEVFEVRTAEGWFVASAAKHAGEPPVPSCAENAAEGALNWSCRQIELGRMRGTEVSYGNELGEVVQLRGYWSSGRTYLLMHVRQAHQAATPHAEFFLSSFRLAP